MATAELLLYEARRLGFLGPGPIEPHIGHARAYAAATTVHAPDLVVDLGSGGGLPALVLIEAGFGRRWVLVERSRSRADWLQRAVHRLGAGERVEVRCTPAETVAATDLGGSADVVTARSFAPLPITAEVSAPLLREGGELIVSLEERRPLPPDGAFHLDFAVIEVAGYPLCRARAQSRGRAPLPRSWRAMQRRPAF